MALFLVSAPSTEPLTIAEVKGHLRIGDTDGEPAPTALTPTLASPAAPGNVDNGVHRYLATFVTADGETEAGTISAAVTVVDKSVNGQVALTAIPLGGSAVTARNLYRTAAAGSTYLKLAQIANNTATTYTDNVADASLGVQAPTANTTADPELVGWIAAARQIAETHTHRALITQTWDLKLDHFPCWQAREYGAIEIPLAPCQSVTSVSYVDTAGVTQTWASTLYDVDLPVGDYARLGMIRPAYQQLYPVTRHVANAVTVRFVAGYGARAAVPAAIKAAMKLLISHWWLHREAVDGSMEELPLGVAALLWPFKSL